MIAAPAPFAVPGLWPEYAVPLDAQGVWADDLTRLAVDAILFAQAHLGTRPGPITGAPIPRYLDHVDPVIVEVGLGPRWVPWEMLGTVRAQLLEGGLWQRSPFGRLEALVPIVDSMLSPPRDLAVFDTDRPERVHFLTGMATCQNLSHLVDEDGPIILFPDLASWFLAQWPHEWGHGAVVFDWRHWGEYILTCGRDIRCTHQSVADLLEARWRALRPKKPNILVPDTRRAA